MLAIEQGLPLVTVLVTHCLLPLPQDVCTSFSQILSEETEVPVVEVTRPQLRRAELGFEPSLHSYMTWAAHCKAGLLPGAYPEGEV